MQNGQLDPYLLRTPRWEQRTDWWRTSRWWRWKRRRGSWGCEATSGSGTWGPPLPLGWRAADHHSVHWQLVVIGCPSDAFLPRWVCYHYHCFYWRDSTCWCATSPRTWWVYFLGRVLKISPNKRISLKSIYSPYKVRKRPSKVQSKKWTVLLNQQTAKWKYFKRGSVKALPRGPFWLLSKLRCIPTEELPWPDLRRLRLLRLCCLDEEEPTLPSLCWPPWPPRRPPWPPSPEWPWWWYSSDDTERDVLEDTQQVTNYSIFLWMVWI